MAKIIPIFAGVVTADGALKLESRDLFRHYLRTLRNKPVAVTVKTQGRPKSRSQLGFLWGVVYPILAEHFGYHTTELDALHDALMRQFVGLRPDPNPLQLRQSLADLDHEKVSAYIDNVRFWGLTEHGCVTPDAHQAESA